MHSSQPPLSVCVCAHIYIDSTHKIMRIFAHNIGTYMHARSTCAERSAKIYATYKHTRAHILHTLCAIIVVIRHTRQHIRPRDTSIWDKGTQRIVEHYVQSNDGTHTQTRNLGWLLLFLHLFSRVYMYSVVFLCGMTSIALESPSRESRGTALRINLWGVGRCCRCCLFQHCGSIFWPNKRTQVLFTGTSHTHTHKDTHAHGDAKKRGQHKKKHDMAMIYSAERSCMRKHFENRARCRLNRSSRDVLSTDAEPATARLCEPSGRAARVSTTTRWREIWLHVCVCLDNDRTYMVCVCIHVWVTERALWRVDNGIRDCWRIVRGGLHARVLRSDRRNKFVTTE